MILGGGFGGRRGGTIRSVRIEHILHIYVIEWNGLSSPSICNTHSDMHAMVDFCSTIRRIKIRIDSIDSSKDRTNIFKIKDIFHSIRTTLTRGRKYEFRMIRINIVSNRTRNVATGVVGGKAGISEQQFQSTCLHCLFVLQYWFYK